MDQSKKGFLPVLHRVKLSKTQCPTTIEDKDKMSVIPYASAIGSIGPLCLGYRFPRISYSLDSENQLWLWILRI